MGRKGKVEVELNAFTSYNAERHSPKSIWVGKGGRKRRE